MVKRQKKDNAERIKNQEGNGCPGKGNGDVGSKTT
jgi:hypothetical protein